ncbi:DUF6228 family protein [Streptomyces sp. MS191]|uniref:DUF6228 family protein n=1 Tax=Streptomyces sp. ms191 TaxID=1827978 RepID=UPI001C9C3C58
MEAVADGLHARRESVSISVWESAGDLTEFLDGLAEDFRGWQGEGRGDRSARPDGDIPGWRPGSASTGSALRGFAEDSRECSATTTRAMPPMRGRLREPPSVVGPDRLLR